MYKGFSYDSRKDLILAYVTFFRYLTTKQIASLVFDFPSGYSKCRQVMKKMYDAKAIKRFRGKQFVYYVERKKQDWQSVMLLNKLYFDIREKGKVIKYQPEMVIFSGRCDGFFVAEYAGKRKKFFVEVDRATTPFNKAKIYNTLLQTDWEGEWWADPLCREVISFPLVVVLTSRRHVVEKDFAKAEFNYYIFDLYRPRWERIYLQ